ncbi:aspartate/glutamate racemase family protein [Aliivibrio salmonicida]|uniref:aspartate/glutamate racemase family protein n=1 Tax=Aliivibrio salmonicida TaxID=40269 RepID=UPI00406CF61D
MSSIQKSRIGIIGGMGNEALVDLIEKIASLPGSEKREYIVFGNARLAYKPEEVVHSWQPTDLPELRKKDTALYTLKLMQHFGVDIMGLACNSAHELFRTLLPNVPVTFVDMLNQTAHTLRGTKDKVLVMGVSSLVNSGLYQSALQEQGVLSTKPSPENQQKIMTAIYDPKFGIKTAQITREAEKLLCDVISEESERQGCSKIVLGCTELPLALTALSCDRFKINGWLPKHIDIIDASFVLAECLLKTDGKGTHLNHPHSFYQGKYIDWFAPLTVQVSSPSHIARIQKDILCHTVDFLAQRGLSVTGSYMHLPTLFISDTAIDAKMKLADMGISIHSENDDLDSLIINTLDCYYTDIANTPITESNVT